MVAATARVDERSDAEREDEERFHRLYGPWVAPSPAEVARLLEGAPFRWWIAGGWAVEALGGRRRHHDDTDVAVIRDDVAAVREWFAEYHLWEVDSGMLRPLVPGDALRDRPEQVWIRRDSTQPWVLDLALTPTDGDDWLYKRDHRVRRPLDEVGVEVEGVAYLRPSIVLLYKARLQRPKDAADFASLRPGLPDDDVKWLDDALALVAPEHPWREALRP